MYIFYTANIKKLTLNKGWHILKVELYENANWKTKLLLLFIIEKWEIIGLFNNIVVQYKILFGVKYITRQYYIH